VGIQYVERPHDVAGRDRGIVAGYGR
jgi:hypothetical protein